MARLPGRTPKSRSRALRRGPGDARASCSLPWLALLQKAVVAGPGGSPRDMGEESGRHNGRGARMSTPELTLDRLKARVAEAPEDPGARLDLANAYEQLGELGLACKEWKRVV